MFRAVGISFRTTRLNINYDHGTESRPVQIGRNNIPTSRQIVFLGIKIDQNMTFAGQVEKVADKMEKRMGVLSALAGRDWG